MCLQAYISNYTSHTKIDRLLFIAEHNPGKPVELEALKLAADEVKQVRGEKGRSHGQQQQHPKGD